ncbi:hypothetical protein STEG23_016497 [Scotinomys teguina]
MVGNSSENVVSGKRKEGVKRIIRIFTSISFPFFPLGTFSPFFAGAFLGLGSGFGGAGLADNLADLLCGSSFTSALSPLVSPPAFLWGMVAAGRRYCTRGCSLARIWSVQGSFSLLIHTALPGHFECP